jgi:hypothetical protein
MFNASSIHSKTMNSFSMNQRPVSSNKSKLNTSMNKSSFNGGDTKCKNLKYRKNQKCKQAKDYRKNLSSLFKLCWSLYNRRASFGCLLA